MPGEPDETSSDDPGLKSAVRRVLGGEQAPALLRARIEAVLQDSMQAEVPVPQPAPETPPRLPLRRNPLFSLAAAAVLLLGLGFVIWRIIGTGGLGPRPPAYPPLPASYAIALVTTHDHCAAAPSHHLLPGVRDDDFRLMSQKLREDLGFPALAAAAGDGWAFRGASPICKVGDAPCAHLLFAKDGQTLSIFSVPVASETWPAGHRPIDGARFSNLEAAHPIVSWVKDGVIYSVVAVRPGGSLDIDAIEPIADHLRTAVIAAVEHRMALALAGD